MADFNILHVESPEIEAAPALLEQWHRTVSPVVLDSMSRTLEKDYIKVGSVRLPKRFGGRFSENTQTLYKPTKP